MKKFLSAIEFIPRGSRVVVAVSGGADSVALLWLFRSFWDGEIIAAHAEHGIRGEASRSDAEFVRLLCQKFGIECVVEHLDVPQNLQKGESVEMAARRLRYAFFECLCSEREAFGVALGHNRDDVAETFLLNLFRGSGVRGLAGIPKRRGVFFRPLLEFSHAELYEILRANGIEWREDATNSENYYLRNKIRNILLPLISKEINPRATEHIFAATRDIYAFREREEAEGERIWNKTSPPNPLSINGEGGHGKISPPSPFMGREGPGVGEVSFPLKKIRALEDWEIEIFIREIGRRYEIGTLSRERTEGLICLLRRSGRFIFQWQKNFTLVASDGALALKIV